MTSKSQSARVSASYQVAVLGYGAGMALSVFGHVPIALLFIAAASGVAAVLFRSAALPASHPA